MIANKLLRILSACIVIAAAAPASAEALAARRPAPTPPCTDPCEDWVTWASTPAPSGAEAPASGGRDVSVRPYARKAASPHPTASRSRALQTPGPGTGRVETPPPTDGPLGASPEEADASSSQSQVPAADLASPTVKLAKAGRKRADRSRRAPEAGARAPDSGQPPIQKPGNAQPAAAPGAEPLAAYVLTRSSVSRLADLGGKAIGMAPLGKVAKAHVDAALRLAHLDGDLASVDEDKAVRRLLDGDLAGLIIDVDQPPKDLASVPLDRFRMLPIYAPGL